MVEELPHPSTTMVNGRAGPLVIGTRELSPTPTSYTKENGSFTLPRQHNGTNSVGTSVGEPVPKR